MQVTTNKATSSQTMRELREIRDAVAYPIGSHWLVADLSECLSKQLRILANERRHQSKRPAPGC
jgi:hypothetical protein